MKPLAFRIKDYKSINDTGVCTLSQDRITALAGQNEAGKTTILQALRDFDLQVGQPPQTADYEPDVNPEEKRPAVAVLFGISEKDISDVEQQMGGKVPHFVKDSLLSRRAIWVTRDLRSGLFDLEESLSTDWAHYVSVLASGPESDESKGAVSERHIESSGLFACELQRQWPSFVYFDSFTDSLPRELLLESYIDAQTEKARDAAYKAFPQSAKDFLQLAEIDLRHVVKIKDNDRLLGNYLATRAARVTGHFLEYWKQKADVEETVTLISKHARDSAGELLLNFYVHDTVDQYADQRSRGFLWFLSFFLRLTSSEVSPYEGVDAFILIDEPGTYLHPRAQKDVLHLLEKWVVKSHIVLYSTHSPYLLPAKNLHRVRIALRQRQNGSVIIDRLTDPRLAGDRSVDAITPVLSAIGLDLIDTFNHIQKRNLITEGVSDYYWLQGWEALLDTKTFADISIFPGTSATTVPTLASLLIGWGVAFSALLDRDDQGNATAKRLKEEMGIAEANVIQYPNAASIEDLLTAEDFRGLVSRLDDRITLKDGETSARAIKRLNLNKVLLATFFIGEVKTGKLKKRISVKIPSTVLIHYSSAFEHLLRMMRLSESKSDKQRAGGPPMRYMTCATSIPWFHRGWVGGCTCRRPLNNSHRS